MIDREKVIAGLEDSLANNGCGFMDGIGELFAVSGEDLQNAIALLKAQEPRVMTLEESYSVDYCFFEYHATGYIEPASVVISGKLLNGKEPLVEVYRLGRDGPAYVMMKDYGHEWRCWDRMPDDEKRMMTPWE